MASGLILSVDKPAGWTSFDVVNKLRGALKWKSVGHAGTLDPPATGVLLLLFGTATRRSDEFMDLPKEYRARIRFGVRTATDDMAGDIVDTREIDGWSAAAIEAALPAFRGSIQQVPPAVSAIKVAGKRAYAAARKGRELDLAPREVHVYSLRLLAVDEPEIEVLITCSRGTYIRSIARDLGRTLGWGGALSALTRTAIGPYRVEQALSLRDVLQRSSEFAAE